MYQSLISFSERHTFLAPPPRTSKCEPSNPGRPGTTRPFNICTKLLTRATVSGALLPLAGVGRATAVTLMAQQTGQTYSATPSAQTGAFSFAAVPVGSYTLTFATTTYATFPVQVSVTVVAGRTTTPLLPALTHDGTVRGTMQWTLNGVTYSASQFLGLFGSSLFLTGVYVADPAPTAVSGDVFLVIPQADDIGPIFAGPGSYPLGLRRIGSFGQYADYPAGQQAGFVQYVTPRFGSQTGTITLTRFDGAQGLATGTFTFTATAGGALHTA